MIPTDFSPAFANAADGTLLQNNTFFFHLLKFIAGRWLQALDSASLKFN